MAMLTIRDLDDDLEAQLGIRSAFGTRIHQQVMALTRGGSTVACTFPSACCPHSARLAL